MFVNHIPGTLVNLCVGINTNKYLHHCLARVISNTKDEKTTVKTRVMFRRFLNDLLYGLIFDGKRSFFLQVLCVADAMAINYLAGVVHCWTKQSHSGTMLSG